MIIFFLLGLIFGSFVSAVTYRMPRGISFLFGRSFCPLCKKQIRWYDNIPLLSFIILGGKCRHCKKRISYRYPLIELATGIGFVFVYLFFGQGRAFSNLPLFYSLPYLLFVFLVLEIIFIIDLEHKFIFDSLVFILFFVFLATSFFLSDTLFWQRLFSSFLVSFFFLFLNLITNGKGMGLGDVKLVLPLGFLLGYPLILPFLFLSFLTGSFVGVILILLGKAKFGKPLPFGPFIIVSFWLTLVLGDKLFLIIK
jgi:leader peptidase (prepilin peptidase)/N-methyltransferase